MSLPMIAIRWDCSGKKGFTNDQFYLRWNVASRRVYLVSLNSEPGRLAPPD